MNITNFFIWYLRYIWPIQRLFVQKDKRCPKCILISDGICEECKNFILTENKKTYVSTDKFYEYMNSSICNSQYDATLLLSGGKDSIYTLHRLKNDFPELKILCLFINTGFMSKYALKNAQYITNKLNVDLMVVNNYVGMFKKTLHDALLHLNGRECYYEIDLAEGKLISHIGTQITKSFKIPTMILGLSWVQVEKVLQSDTFSVTHNNITQVYPLVVWRTDEQDIRKYVVDNELVLKGSDNPIVSNSTLVPTMMAIDIMNMGYSSFESEFAQLIREGKSSRNTWLSIFELLKYFTTHGYLNREVKETLNKLDLTLEEVIGK